MANSNQLFKNFKNHFEALTPEQQVEYLDRMGFVFVANDISTSSKTVEISSSERKPRRNLAKRKSYHNAKIEHYETGKMLTKSALETGMYMCKATRCVPKQGKTAIAVEAVEIGNSVMAKSPTTSKKYSSAHKPIKVK